MSRVINGYLWLLMINIIIINYWLLTMDNYDYHYNIINGY